MDLRAIYEFTDWLVRLRKASDPRRSCIYFTIYSIVLYIQQYIKIQKYFNTQKYINIQKYIDI